MTTPAVDVGGIASSGIADGGSTTFNQAVTLAANRWYIVWVTNSDGTPQTVTLAWVPTSTGTPETCDAASLDMGVLFSFMRAAVWVVNGASFTAGAGNFRATFAGAQGERMVTVVPISGDVDVTPFVTPIDSASASGGTYSVTADPTVAGKLCVALAEGFDTGPPTVWAFNSPSDSEHSEVQMTGGAYHAHAVQSGTASGATKTMTWTITANGSGHGWAGVVVVFNESTGQINPPAGGITLTGAAPSVDVSGQIIPAAGSVRLTGRAPRISYSGARSLIEFRGSDSGTTSATIPTHAAGDLIIAFAYRDGNNTQPSIPAGQNWTTLHNAAGNNTNSHVVVYKIAAGSSEATGTFTSATSTVVHVYRGQRLVTPIGTGHQANGGSSTTVNYPAVTFDVTNGTSWAVGFGGHRSVNTALETPPALMGNRTTVVDGTDEAAGHDTSLGVSTWASTNVSVAGTSSGWRSHVLELISALYLVPDSGEIVLAGFAPDVSAAGSNTTVTPAAGSVVLTGDAPNFAFSGMNVPAGSLVLTGAAPTVSVTTGLTIVPGAASLVLTGSLPLQTYTIPAPAPASLVLTGFAPSLVNGKFIQPDAASLVLTGSAPQRGQTFSITPAAGAVVLTGAAATFDFGMVPAAGAVVLIGAIPTLSFGSVTVTPAAGAVVLGGASPTLAVTEHVTLTPGAGALVLTGSAPNFGQTYSLTPGAGSIVLIGSAPQLGQTYSITPGAGSTVLTGFAPQMSVTAAGTISPFPGSIVLTGSAPLLDLLLRPGAGSVVLSGAAPTMSLGIQPASGSVVLGGHAPVLTLTEAWFVTPGAGSVVLNASVPTVLQAGSISLTPAAAALVLSCFAPLSLRTSDEVFALVTASRRARSGQVEKGRRTNVSTGRRTN